MMSRVFVEIYALFHVYNIESNMRKGGGELRRDVGEVKVFCMGKKGIWICTSLAVFRCFGCMLIRTQRYDALKYMFT